MRHGTSSAPFYSLGEGPFATTHEAFVGIDEIDWSRPLADGDETAREDGRRTFVHRAVDEQRSLIAFSELLTALCQSGAPIDVIGSLTRVVRDEALHVDLCDRMVRRLGGWPEAAPTPRIVSLPAKWSLEQRVLATILGSLCVGETISVALLARARGNATDPVAHEVLTRMLADESFHSRFGFWWLDAFPRSDGAQAFAERFVARILRSVVVDFLPTQTGAEHRDTRYGGVAAEARREAVVEAIEKTVVPSFERAGISAQKSWALAQAEETDAS
jgi:hypothetical protein